jgi:uncharacterized membrane protein YfcA
MEISEVLLLLAAGLAAGTVNAVAGGGSLVTFPTLVAIGLPPVAANVSNSVAVFPGYLASVFGSRADLVGQRSRLRGLIPTAIVGTGIGCLLLLVTPARTFELIVPFLVLAAAGMLAFQERLRGLVGHPHDMSPRRQAVALHAMVGLGSVYGGYFGAALGVMLVAALALVLAERLTVVNALKNVFSAVVGLVTVVVFALFGPVNWATVAVLTPATLIGGYLGARLARRLPARVLRAVIVTFGTVIGIVLLIRAL